MGRRAEAAKAEVKTRESHEQLPTFIAILVATSPNLLRVRVQTLPFLP